MHKDLTYHILAWADVGGKRSERSTELNSIDCKALHAAIEGMINRGLIEATPIPTTHADTFQRYMNPRLTPTGCALYKKKHAAPKRSC